MKGIYQITNIKNDKRYIGSSVNMFKRWNQHIYNLQNKIHHSHLLQDDWNKYNINDFQFSIIELLPSVNKNKLLETEQLYLDGENFDNLYNIMSSTSYKSISLPTELKDNINYIHSIDEQIKTKLKQNIIILEKKGNLSKIGNKKYDLSKTWFLKNQAESELLKNNIRNAFYNYMKVKSKEIAWTTYTQYYKSLTTKGIAKSFVPLNGEIEGNGKRNYLCFAANCFPNSFMKREFENENIQDDIYALSLLVKWIINVSDIEKEINIYIPSLRMEQLFINWLNNSNIEEALNEHIKYKSRRYIPKL